MVFYISYAQLHDYLSIISIISFSAHYRRGLEFKHIDPILHQFTKRTIDVLKVKTNWVLWIGSFYHSFTCRTAAATATATTISWIVSTNCLLYTRCIIGMVRGQPNCHIRFAPQLVLFPLLLCTAQASAVHTCQWQSAANGGCRCSW